MSERGASGGIGSRSITAVLWGTGATVVRIGVQVVSQIVLVRLLGPDQYGLFAAALVVVFFSSFFSDVGLSYGLIQRQIIDERDIRFVFTWQIVLGIAVTAALFLSAPLFTRLFNEVRLEPILRWLSITCLINACGSTSTALLKRDLDYKWLNIGTLVSYAVGFFVVGIPLAMAGAGVGALVAAFLVQTALSQIISYARSRHPVRPLFWYPAGIDAIRFGGTVLITNLLNWVMSSIDRVVIGRTFAMTGVGLYSTVYNLINMPAMTAIGLVQSVLYSASTRVQDDRARLQAGFLTMLSTMAVFGGAVFCAVASVAPTIVLAIYGDKWTDAAPLAVPLALAMPLFLTMGMAIPAMWASGNAKLEFRLQMPIAAVWALSVVLLSRLGSLELMAWGVMMMFLLRATVIVRATLKCIGLQGRALARPIAGGLLVSGIVSLCVKVADVLARQLLDVPVAWLAIDAAAGMVSLAGAMRLFRRQLDPRLMVLLGKLSDRLPRRFAGPVGRWFGAQV
ncbi:MAG: lipopolysaccharide biosynthesis protein [Burkholderiaceae bacterium]|nr:lipopolysaccharide biosynthesis protein [Burkholderiaceae bacterium]